jgi:hypothetical protein
MHHALQYSRASQITYHVVTEATTVSASVTIEHHLQSMGRAFGPMCSGTATHSLFCLMVQFAADGFVGLQSDVFGHHYERSALETVTAYVVIWACVLMVIFLFYNFAIAVVFMSYAKLQSHFKKMIEKDKADAGNVKVCALRIFACLQCFKDS